MLEQRVVLITELEFQLFRGGADRLLLAHGIVPWRPYLHEQDVHEGHVVHRYTQPVPARARRQGGLPMPEHPVPTHREVWISVLDKQTHTPFELERLLKDRGMDPTQPFTQEERPGFDGDVYVQAISPQKG